MPPKVVKRGSAAKKAKVSSKTSIQNPPQEPEPESIKNHEDNHVDDSAVEENSVETVPNGVAMVENNGEEVKESIDEYEKDEHLDFEDNYHEYDPEEYVGDDDYDERGIEQDEGQEAGDEVEEEPEENVDEEEGDTGDEEVEEVEYVYEEVEGDDDDVAGDDEHASEENVHGHLADVKEEEQVEVIKETQKQKELEVFVGGLDKEATEHDLRKVFSKVGEITEVRMTMNPQTKRNKGFALLRFETVEHVKRALAELKNPVINGKQCGITITTCQDSDTLYLDNICKSWKKEALKEKLKHYGVESFKDLTLLEDGNNEGTNCGCAFLEFSSHSDSKDAYKRLQKTDVVFGVDKPAEVSFANSFIDLGDDIMAQVYFYGTGIFLDLISLLLSRADVLNLQNMVL